MEPSPKKKHELTLWNQIIANLPIPREGKSISKPIWKHESNKLFSTTFVKKVIFTPPLNTINGVDSHLFLNISKSCIPKKCKFFNWFSLLHKCIKTMEVL